MSEVLVSVVIPCRNEEKYISKCLHSILNQKKVFGKIEIIVVDGLSDDSTVDIVKSISESNPRIILLSNKNKFTPFALNMGIEYSAGKYVVIMGAHAIYDENYLFNCLTLFEQHPEVSCVGGPIVSDGLNIVGKGIAAAMSHPIGVGNAKHRFPDYEGYAEMACFPMFKRNVFRKIGYYDTSLIKNQDDEFCFRLRRNGDLIFISPKVKSLYIVRSSFSALYNQYFNYGFFRLAVILKYKTPISFRQVIPTLFYFSMLILLLGSLLAGKIWIGIILPLAYILTIISVALFSDKINYTIIFPFILSTFILHFSYSAGFIKAVFLKLFKTKQIVE